jgi:anti-sigma-K factor RskA
MTEEPERQDLAAYALGLLEDPDRAAVEAHVRSCPDCAEELAEYRAAIALLPHAQRTEQAPTEAWEAIAARIRGRDENQTRGVTSAGWRPGRWARLTRVLGPALAATLTAAVIGLIAWNASLQVRLSNRQSARPSWGSASGATAAALFGVGDAAASGLNGYLVMSSDRRQGGLVVGGLSVLPSERSYQVWFVRPDQSRVAGGTFRVDELGQAVKLVTVPQPANDFDGVAITDEPGGGSTAPTGLDLLAGPIYESQAGERAE